MEPRKPEVEAQEPIIETPAEPVVQPEVAKKEAENSELIAKLQKDKEESEARYQEAQRKIAEVANEKATLEARLLETERKDDPTLRNEVEEALSVAQLDPAKGADKLANLMTRTREKDKREAIAQALDTVQKQQKFQMEFSAHVEKVRANNPQLKRYENVIARMAADKMQLERKPYNVAIDEAVQEFKKLREEDLKEQIGATPAPKGSQGESTASGARPLEKAVNEPPEEEGETDRDYVAARKKEFAKRI